MTEPIASYAVRKREDRDLASCAQIARRLHEVDGYPAFLPDGDFEHFLAPTNLLAAWVATTDDTVVAHVCSRTSSAPAATELIANTLALGPDDIAFVSRLMVLPEHRRRGLARCLLEAVRVDIQRVGRTPVLDVLTRDVSAIQLYERSGWRRLGTAEFTSRSGQHFEEAVYVWGEQRG